MFFPQLISIVNQNAVNATIDVMIKKQIRRFSQLLDVCEVCGFHIF